MKKLLIALATLLPLTATAHDWCEEYARTSMSMNPATGAAYRYQPLNWFEKDGVVTCEMVDDKGFYHVFSANENGMQGTTWVRLRDNPELLEELRAKYQ